MHRRFSCNKIEADGPREFHMEILLLDIPANNGRLIIQLKNHYDL